MRALVTGAAGFIGSHLTERLLADGCEVIGIDSFTDYYDPAVKRANIAAAAVHPRFQLVEDDLVDMDLRPWVRQVDVVFHQAGQPGTRLSWSDGFDTYVRRNVVATQRLLEAAKGSRISRLVYASSSSLYGNADAYPCTEQALPSPFSPYGVTKLAAEHLCSLYAQNYGVPAVALRYFTVYGPRQRPDMGVHIFVRSVLRGDLVRIYGDGGQVRDFTYVDDIVEANVSAATADLVLPQAVNVAGGGAVSVAELLEVIGEAADLPVRVEHLDEQPGDVQRTGGSTARAQALLSWKPTTSLPEGVRAQVDWQRAFEAP
jgi:UDP-glucuronate 4-epimerase